MSALNEKPSNAAIDNFNKAKQNPVYAVLDDTNIDIATIFTVVATIISIFVFRTSYVKALSLAALIIVPLRIFLPFPTKPTGLALITGTEFEKHPIKLMLMCCSCRRLQRNRSGTRLHLCQEWV